MINKFLSYTAIISSSRFRYLIIESGDFMLFDFYPWEIESDVEKTRELYRQNDHSLDKSINARFKSSLTQKQLEFFDSLGVNLDNIYISEYVYEIPEDVHQEAKEIYKMSVHFLITGKFTALTGFQKRLYNDEQLFGDGLPKDLKIIELEDENAVPAYTVDGISFSFKHPKFVIDKPRFQAWDCGYIVVCANIMKDLSLT